MPTQHPIFLGILSSALSDDPRSAAALSRRLGFTGLQFEAYSNFLDLTSLSITGQREFRHMLSSQGQQLTALRFDVGPRGCSPGTDVDRILSRLNRAMESSAALEARLLCVDLGPMPPVERRSMPKPAINPDQAGLLILPAPSSAPIVQPVPLTPTEIAFTQQLDSAMGEIGRLADRYNVIVAFRSDLAGFDAIERALLMARCPWFGVDLDAVAVLCDAWSVDEIFSRLGPLIRHVRGRDALSGADRRTQPTAIGQGRTDWPVLLAALASADYHGWITVDPTDLPDRAAAAKLALAHLFRLLGLPLLEAF